MEKKGISKIPKLNVPDDFINWRRTVNAFISQNDTDFLGLSATPEHGTTTQICRWYEFNVKAKSIVTLNLNDSPLTQESSITCNENHTANDL